MKLPELSESASPEFTDAATCKGWLEHVPLANVAAAQGELLAQLDEFNRFPTTAAQRQAPSDDWRALHETYAASEKLDVAEDTVKDFLNRDIQDTSPRIAYARGVLMGLCNPNELGQRQLTFVAYLLERWGGKLEVQEKPVDEGEGVAPLIADLTSDPPPGRGERKARE